MNIGDIKRVKRTRKARRCDWCNEMIETGEPNVNWFTFGESVSTYVHPECFGAQEIAIDYGDYLPPPGTFRRGCSCGERVEDCACEGATFVGDE